MTERSVNQVTDADGEDEFLELYVKCLQRASEGQDIMREQATTIFKLEAEVRNLDIKMASYDRQRTILESLDGTRRYRTRPRDGRIASDLGSHKSLLQYKTALNEVNRQLAFIEERRKLVCSLEQEVEKLEAKKALLGQENNLQFDLRRPQEVG